MFCTNCGNHIKKRASACMHCGAKKNTGTSYCYKCSTPLRGNSHCTSCGSPVITVTPPSHGHYTAGKGDGYEQVNQNNKSFNKEPDTFYPDIKPSVKPNVRPNIKNIQGAEKKKQIAFLLAIFLGGYGVHNFYLGYTRKAIRQLIFTLIFQQIGYLWGWYDAYKIKIDKINTDANGNPLI